MNSSPLFSIVTASYNSDKTIYECIESVLNTNFNDFEFIIVDGNSKDRTVEIIRSFEEKFAARNIAFRWISEADKGIYDAWNKALSMCQGKWISFLGSDDEYFPDALLNYSSFISENPEYNYVCSRVNLIDQNKKILRVLGKPFDNKAILRNMAIAHVGSFHHKSLFENFLFSLDYKIVSDYDFFIKKSNVIRSGFFNTVTANMRDGGVSNNVYKALKEAMQVKLANKKSGAFLPYYDFALSYLKCTIKKFL